MIRLIKRYESRKLYDTEESRYVSLQEVAGFVRDGQQVRVVESASEDDVTAQTLAQVILEEGRTGERRWSPEMLHELVRRGERALQSTFHSGAEQVQHGVDSLLRGSIGRLQPVRKAREELSRLRSRLDELEDTLSEMAAESGSDSSKIQAVADADVNAAPRAAGKSRASGKRASATPASKKKPTKRRTGVGANRDEAGSPKAGSSKPESPETESPEPESPEPESPEPGSPEPRVLRS